MGRTITLYEDQQTNISINQNQYDDILGLKRIWGSQNCIFQADGTILLKHYVGFIATRQLKLQVLPKIYAESDPEKSEQEHDEAMQVLFRLLYYSGYLNIKELPEPQNIKQYQSNLLELFISIFISRFFQLFIRDIHRKYEVYRANMQYIKGKVLFQETLRRNLHFKHLHYVEYDEFTVNTFLNKIFKTIILRLLNHTSSSNNKKNLKKALIYLEDVDTIRLTKTVFDKVYFNRLNENYHPLFNMAKMFYYNLQPGCHEGDEYTFTFLVPLNKLFEYFTYKLIDNYCSKTDHRKEVLHESPRLKLARSNGKGEFTLKPDITIRENKEIQVILDAKYKNPEKGILQSDIYQMVAYALRYNCKRLYLVYPAFHEVQKPVEIINCYTIPTEVGDIELFTIQVDLREKDMGLLQKSLGCIF